MKKVMSMLLAAALCAGVFAGCSGTDTASSAADAASQADASQADASQADSSEGEEGGTVNTELSGTVSTNGSTSMEEVMQGLIEYFNEEYPNITVTYDPTGSGTRGAFEELTGTEDACSYAQELTSTGAVRTAVSTTPGAIGYVSFDSVDDTVKTLKVGGVEISTDTIKDGSYTLQRPFVMVTKEGAELSDAAQAFLDYVLSDEGQEVCVQVGLVSIN